MGTSEELALRHRDEIDLTGRGTESDTDVVAPGEPTRLGGRFLVGLMTLAAVVWVVSLVQLVQLPAQQGSTTTEWNMAIWVALALASAISTFILGFWKVHRI
ncbi:hypothetical protein AFL01nite_00060 [Aeromicrobium flavum]|uniref:Uncharacterized protein n=1 Tax=Aeromicrobium flavum TaxID=416568 RepID=A0A512HQF9_9ACTN|nr:hypothetical protein [Aeromicrobium flavum]GEO87679.1 hypothetical protein AFL01nite_00060 [Aeromicrobium flavum]